MDGLSDLVAGVDAEDPAVEVSSEISQVKDVTLMAFGMTMKYIVNRSSIGVVAMSPNFSAKDDFQAT